VHSTASCLAAGTWLGFIRMMKYRVRGHRSGERLDLALLPVLLPFFLRFLLPTTHPCLDGLSIRAYRLQPNGMQIRPGRGQCGDQRSFRQNWFRRWALADFVFVQPREAWISGAYGRSYK